MIFLYGLFELKGEKTMKYFKKMIGENIYLSPMSIEDCEKFTEWLNDFDTTDYIGRSCFNTTLESENEFLEKNSNGQMKFMIVRLEDDVAIGTISLDFICNINRRATLGIFIGDKSGRNKGYGTQAIRLMLDYGFNYLNLNNIKLDVLEFNQRALACYKKCGFKEYGRRRKANFVNGKYYDIIEMDILSEEFKESFIKNKNI